MPWDHVGYGHFLILEVIEDGISEEKPHSFGGQYGQTAQQQQQRRENHDKTKGASKKRKVFDA